MAQQLVTVVSVKMLYVIPNPRTIWASDDPNDDEVYVTRYNPSADLVEEVFAKLLAFQRNGTPVQLMIEDQRYIIRDPSYPLPDLTAHLQAARNASNAVHAALDLMQEAMVVGQVAGKKWPAKPKKPARRPAKKKTSSKTRARKTKK